MKHLISFLSILMVCGVCFASTVDSGEIWSIQPATQLIFEGDDGREAVIDFGGDEITYSGDLPVSESAKLFFEAFNNLCREEYETRQ